VKDQHDPLEQRGEQPIQVEVRKRSVRDPLQVLGEAFGLIPWLAQEADATKGACLLSSLYAR
jgi:hypothetical protein